VAQLEQVQKVLGGFRITIFDEARRKLGLKEGDYVIVRLEDGSLRVVPAEVRERTEESKKSSS
jgi:AbrB family looped-hinge helix DNA binding protein